MRKVLIIFSILVATWAIYQLFFTPLINTLEVPRITSALDKDTDGVDDFTDLVASARSQIGVVTKYDTGYYGNGGYPPVDAGACADVIWRTFDDVGYDIKALLEKDIKNHPERYGKAFLSDSNINFRRTENLRQYLKYNAQKLSTDIKPGDKENLAQWQGGDIVTYEQIPGGLWHIAIVSDKRRADGVPLLIHNHGYGVVENDYLLDWPTKISGHFRLNQ